MDEKQRGIFVDESLRNEFKALAAKRNMTMKQLAEALLREEIRKGTENDRNCRRTDEGN